MSCYLVAGVDVVCGRCGVSEEFEGASVVMASPADLAAMPEAARESCAFCGALLNEGGEPDDDGEPCEECERSNGPHYRGPCGHGGK